MPSLVLCGYRTALSGDDLEIFTAFAVALRLLQLIFAVPLLVLMPRIRRREMEDEGGAAGSPFSSCPEHDELFDAVWPVQVAYFSLLVVVVVVSLLVELLM